MKIKRLYHDMRIGQGVLFPIISMINFVIISYSLTSINEIIQMEIYIPIVVITVMVALVLIGNQFRHRQQPTDAKLNYEKNYEQLKTDLIILKALPKTKEVTNRIIYLQNVINKGEKK